MPSRTLIPVLLAAALAVASLPASAHGQGTPAPAPCSNAPKSANPCPATPPASTPAAPAQQFPYPGDPAPTTAPPAAPSSGAGKQFPYPGDAKADDSSSSSGSGSSSSSSSSSSSNPNDPDDPLDPSGNTPPPSSTGNTVRRKLPKPTHLQSDDEREAEDVKVATYYADSGNNLGAYNRLKDAVKLIHNDPDAFYLLGTVASRLGKQPESAEAYNKFLDLEPDTRRAKALRHSLSDIQAKK